MRLRRAAVLALVLCVASATCAFCDKSERYDYYNRVRSNAKALRENVQLRMDENPPYVLRLGNYVWRNDHYVQEEHKTFFHRDGDYWVIDDIPKDTILTVPEGYNARCVSFHTKAVSGGTGKTLDNGRVIYPTGAKIKYTLASSLALYKKP